MSTAAERAARRRETWSIHRVDRDPGTAPCPEDPGERIAMVEVLSQRAWALSGRPLPDYERASMPIKIIRAERSG